MARGAIMTGMPYRWAPLRKDPRYQALLRQVGAVQ
jgi:hypothetical protein